MASDDSMAEEPTLPQMPSWSQVPSGHDSYGRKRSYPFKAPGTEGTPSSDIGVFSSDDDPALDNYVRTRQKRRYRGTWYEHNRMMSDPRQTEDDSQEDVNQTPKAKTRGKRSYEHGSSTGRPPPTPPSSNSLQSQAHSLTPRTTPAQGLPSSQILSSSNGMSSSQGFASSQGYSTEPARKQLAVRQAIESCIDSGESLIDLGNMVLDDECISVDTFQPLIGLRLVPRVYTRMLPGHTKDPLTTSKDGYLHRESKIVLIMANHRLTRVPGTLFDIENLTELSLRNNRLTELPPAIAQCQNLRSLNLSSNRLRSLPFELIERLPMLDTLNVAGNDFYEHEHAPMDSTRFPRQTVEIWPLPDQFSSTTRGGNNRRFQAWYWGRGAVQYSDAAGRIYSAFCLPPGGGERNRIVVQDPNEHAGPLTRHQGESRSRPGSTIRPTAAPSLVELCARNLAKSGFPEDYGDMTLEPDLLAKAVAAAVRVRYLGGQCCAVCKKAFVIARTQWVDFFYYDTVVFDPDQDGDRSQTVKNEPKSIIPSLRSGCSWKCVPLKNSLRPGDRVPLKF